MWSTGRTHGSKTSYVCKPTAHKAPPFPPAAQRLKDEVDTSAFAPMIATAPPSSLLSEHSNVQSITLSVDLLDARMLPPSVMERQNSNFTSCVCVCVRACVRACHAYVRT